jgi:acetyl-CoA carboxylase carboxyl transferase subunit beta
MIDRIVSRLEMRDQLGLLLRLLGFGEDIPRANQTMTTGVIPRGL